MPGTNWRFFRKSPRNRGHFFEDYTRGFSPSYWRALERRHRTSGKISTNLFRINTWVKTEQESASYLWQIVLKILGQTAFAILLVTVSLAIDHYVSFLRIDPQVIRTMFSVTLQISAVFIGLYFAAISVIASTVYARVPGDVRSILMREKFGNVYIRIVALLGVTSLLLLIANAYRYPMGVSVVVVVGFLGIVSIFAFVNLGIRAFYFFDPSVLAEYIVVDLISSIKSATNQGYRWNDAVFQTRYQVTAEKALTTLYNVLDVLTREIHPSGPAIGSIGKKTLNVLNYYSAEKLRIPTQSYWFKRMQKGRDWLTTDYSQIEIAVSTGTALMPEVIPDQLWFEKLGEKTVVAVIEALLDQKDLLDAITVENGIQQALNAMGRNAAIDEGVHLCTEVWPIICLLANEQRFLDLDNREDIEFGVYFIDFFCLGVLNLILGFAHFLRDTNLNSFGNSISKIDWREKADLYTTGMPRAVIEKLEYLKKGFETEIAIEERICTPDWYRKQIALLGFARMLTEGVTNLINLVYHVFPTEVGTLIDNKNFVFAAAFIERGIETCEKAQLLVTEAEECITRLLELRLVGDIPWPVFDWEGHRSRLNGLRTDLIARYAESLSPLSQLDIPEGLPDYFGHGYTLLAEACFTALLTRDENQFNRLYPFFFQAGLIAYDRVGTRFASEDARTNYVVKKQVLLDLMAISGYSQLFSELDGKEYWDVVQDSWNRFLDNSPDSRLIVRLLLGVVQHDLYSLFFAPRDMVRTTWKQAFERRMHSEGLAGDDELYEIFETHTRPRLHRSPLINAINAGAYISGDPEEVFIIYYLMERPEADDVDLSARTDSLLESILRQIERNNDEDNDA